MYEEGSGPVFDAQSTCRACLANREDVRSMYPEEFSLMWECAQVKVETGDGLPQGLCPTCRERLVGAHDFRRDCRRSDALLRQSQTIKAERSDDNILVVDGTSEKKKFKCPICQRPISEKKYLKKHIEKMHGSQRRRHRQYCTGWGKERRYSCPECSYATPHGPSLKRHLRTHTGEKPFKCEVCSRPFARFSALTSHKKVHSDDMPFTCSVCGRRFKRHCSLLSHQKTHDDRPKTIRYICDLCEAGFRFKRGLITHLNRHYNIRNHACETCGSLFHSADTLYKHSKIHVTEKRHSCPCCDFKTHMKLNLEKHIVRHSGFKPFECDLCDMRFYFKSELTCHRKKHKIG